MQPFLAVACGAVILLLSVEVEHLLERGLASFPLLRVRAYACCKNGA